MMESNLLIALMSSSSRKSIFDSFQSLVTRDSSHTGSKLGHIFYSVSRGLKKHWQLTMLTLIHRTTH